MLLNRREMCSLFPAAFLPIVDGVAASATQDVDPDQVAVAQEAGLPSATYPWENLPVRATNSAQVRHILKGKLATGESLEAHETTLAPGAAPHPPHHHVHSEMWLIREGTVELTINGASHVLGPGSLGFVRSNEEHGIKNVGTAPATYFVVAVGPGAGA